MKKQFKLGVIGCGPMAQSVLKGAVLSDFLHEKKIIVYDSSEERLEEISSLGVRTALDCKTVADNSEILLLALKPKDFVQNIKSLGFSHDKIISVMSGVKKNTVKNAFGLNAVKVARGIPNLPCSIGSGVIGIDMTDYNNSTDDIEFISNLFNCIGTVLSIDESKMDAVTALGGSGPAYVLMFIESLVDAGTKQGLTKNEAKILAVQTLIGTAEMVERDEDSISDLMLQACGKGGTAIEAIKVFEDKNFRGIISEAVTACVNRAKELSER